MSSARQDGSRCGSSAAHARFERHIARDLAWRDHRDDPELASNFPPVESYIVEVPSPNQEVFRNFSADNTLTNGESGNVTPNTSQSGAQHRTMYFTREGNITGVSGRVTSPYRSFRVARFPVSESDSSQERHYSPVPVRFPSNPAHRFVHAPATASRYAVIPASRQHAANPRYALTPAANLRHAVRPSSNPTEQELPSPLNAPYEISASSASVQASAQRPTSPVNVGPSTQGEMPDAPDLDNNSLTETITTEDGKILVSYARFWPGYEDEKTGYLYSGEERMDINNQENETKAKEDEDMVSETSSDLEAGFGLARLDLTEDAEPDNEEEMGASAGATGASKYLTRLKKIQTQSTEEECDEENEDDQSEGDVLDASKYWVEEEEDSPGFREGETPDLNNITRSVQNFLENMGTPDWPERYRFREDNPMLNLDNPFEEGLRRLEVGDIPSAVLCFEAAAQIDSENAQVWQYLGTTQAANEQDGQAIRALKQCLKLQPDNLTALMALAVSYTNEGLESLVITTLRKWLMANPQYSDIVTNPPVPGGDGNGVHMNMDAFREVLDYFIQAANRHPTGGDLDPEVQCALGVMFNLVGDCTKAADCFRAALSVTPEDSRMWNRLGATLANGRRSSEAVEAYYKSLGLNPGYVRARYNLGLSCIHLQFYKEALMHLLKALNQQASGVPFKGLVGQMSNTIWVTTRIVLGYLGRNDLIPVAENRDLDKLLKEFPI